jgi:hypothetical protein
MDPQQALELLQQLGITPDLAPMVKQALDVVSGGGAPPMPPPGGAGGPPPGMPPM